MMKAALLDAAGIYLGIVEVDKTELTARHLPQIPECDLEPGRWRWNGKYMEPLKAAEIPPEEGAPALEEVVYLLATGQAADARVRAWTAWYAKTIDGRALRLNKKG
jgi:hypothetical protein